jgi:hypothetical protein
MATIRRCQVNKIVEWLLGLVALGVASLVINFVLLVLKVGNLKTILFIRKLTSGLSELPGEVLLSCTANQVSAVTFDMSQSRERIIPLYSGILTWKGSPRPASRVLARARRQLTTRSLIFIAVFLPLIVLGAWITLFVNWTGIFFIALLVFHQFVPFYIWEYPAFSSLLHGD